MPERLSTFPNSRGGGPEYNTDYTLSLRPDKQELKLAFQQSFLQAHEWSNGDISPEITFTADDGRKFGKKFSMNLKVNTAPILEYAGIGKTTVGPDEYYVLIFHAKDMDTMIGTQHVHKDINIMNVTAGGVSRPPITLSVIGSDFATGGDLLAAVSQLDTAHLLPTGNGLLRLKTDVKVGGPETEYSVSIKDSQGLSSAVISAKTKKNKLSDVQLFDGFTPIPDPTDSTSAGATDGNPKVFAGMSGKILTAKAAPDGARITGKVEKQNSDGTWTEISGGTVNGTTSAVINLPALAAGEDEALYKISLKAALSGYDDSDSKDFFVKLVRQEVPVLKLVQNFKGTPYEKNISTAAKGYVTEDIIPFAGNYNTATKPLVIYNLNGRAAFVIAPRTGSGATVMYKLNTDPEHSATTEAPIRLPNAPATHTLQVWAVKNGVEGPKTTLHIKVIKAITAYSELKNVVQNAPAGNEIKINIANDITAPADIGNTEIAVTGGKKLIALPKPGDSSHIINAAGKGRIFNISGSGTELTLEDIKLEDGYASTGGAAYVEAGGILALTGQTLVTPSTGSEINTPGKNDVYLATGTSIKVDSTLMGSGTIARITPNYTDGNMVLTGSKVNTEYAKFSVTQQDDGFLWTIKDDGTLKAIPTIIHGGGSDAWKRLKEAVEKLPEGSTITINGEIKATKNYGNSGEIVIAKNLTIKGKTGAASDILNANSTTSDDNAPSVKHRIFKVEPGKTLTLKNLTLKNGKAQGTGLKNCGGAVFVAVNGKLYLTQVNMNNNHAALKGGAVYFLGISGSPEKGLTVEGGEFTGNRASDTSSGNGGAFALIAAKAEMKGVKIKQNFAGDGAGIYVGTGSGTSELTLTNSDTYGITEITEISNNGTLGPLTASNGGGIYFASGSLTIQNGVQIKQNKAQKGGGIYVIDASCTMSQAPDSTLKPEISGNTATAFGAGIYLHKSSDTTRLTMNGGKISGNSVLNSSGNPSGEGGGIYTELAAKIKLNNGTIENNQAEKGGAVYANYQCDFSMRNSARITPSSDTNANKTGQNDVYLEEHTSGNAKIKLDGALTGTGPVARITVADSQYSISTQVLTAGSGVALAKETYKFTVTPKIEGGTPQPWTVGGNGYLKPGRYTEVPYGQLETYLANASETEVNYIEVTGPIPADDLKGTAGASPSPGTLGQLLKSNAYKKVALKLPSGLSVPNMDHCFAKCENLVSVENLPSDVMSMQACFSGCVNLTTGPDIPATVTHMRECFWGCTRLQSVKINCPYNTTTYAFYRAFTNCTALENGGIKVPSLYLAIYKVNAGTMGTTADKFAGF